MLPDKDAIPPPEEPPTPVAKVHIVVAGHEILVEAAADLNELAKVALHLFDRTAASAARIPVGFDIPPPDISPVIPADDDEELDT